MPMSIRVNRARLGIALVAALSAGFAAAPAAANVTAANVSVVETVQLRYVSPAAALVTQVRLPLGNQNYYVGNYNFQTQTPDSSFQAYCVDPFQYASASYRSYEKSALSSFLSASAQKLADVTSLFAHAYAGTIGNATKAAGFQLALWEVFSDDRNLASGNVFTTTRTNGAAVAEANSLLANVAAASWTTPAEDYDLTIFSNGQAQDYLAATLGVGPSTTPVPEPESAALMLAGLGLLGFASRRREERNTTA